MAFHVFQFHLQVEVNRQSVGPHQLLHQILFPVWDVQLHIYRHRYVILEQKPLESSPQKSPNLIINNLFIILLWK